VRQEKQMVFHSDQITTQEQSLQAQQVKLNKLICKVKKLTEELSFFKKSVTEPMVLTKAPKAKIVPGSSKSFADVVFYSNKKSTLADIVSRLKVTKDNKAKAIKSLAVLQQKKMSYVT